jgi:hypothetical protein
LLVACLLSACSIKRIEDVMGPSASLAQPPQDLVTAAPTISVDETDIDPSLAILPPAEKLTPVLAAQDKSIQIGSEAQWHAFLTDDGYDVTDASGTVCSGRLISAASSMASGQRIPLACSDGQSAILEVSKLTAAGATGVLIIDRKNQSVVIANASASP